MGVVVFDPVAFKIRYPAFAAVDDDLLQECFDDACQYLNNTDSSPVCDLSRRARLLNMLVAHIATLTGAPTNNVAAPVGRANSATEGSVSIGLDYSPAMPGSGAWFNQTQYGAMFWQATTSLRGFRYIPRPTRY